MKKFKLEEELNVVKRFTDKELETTHVTLPELLQEFKIEIFNLLESDRVRIISIRRHNATDYSKCKSSPYYSLINTEKVELTEKQLEFEEYLNRYGGEVDIDQIYKDYFKFMDKYEPLMEKYNRLLELHKQGKEVDKNSFDSHIDLYHTRISPEAIKKLAREIRETKNKIEKLDMPRLIVDIFERYSIYVLTYKYKEIENERKSRGLDTKGKRTPPKK